MLAGVAFGTLRVHSEYVARNTEVITFNGGGVLPDFIERFNTLRQSGKYVVIDGFCMSACTMIVGLIPPDRLCATPYAKLGFHSASTRHFLTGEREDAPQGTRLLWRAYPEALRELLRTKYKWDGDDAETSEHPNMIFIEGDELATIVKPCASTK